MAWDTPIHGEDGTMADLQDTPDTGATPDAHDDEELTVEALDRVVGGSLSRGGYNLTGPK
jgi:hypothetical protein